MEEYTIFQDYQRVMQYNEEQRNSRRVIDPEELEYWKKVFKEETTDFKPDPESDEPF